MSIIRRDDGFEFDLWHPTRGGRLLETFSGPTTGEQAMLDRGMKLNGKSGINGPGNGPSPDEDLDATGPERGACERLLEEGFLAACKAVMDDTSLDVMAKLAKVKTIMSAQEKLLDLLDGAGADMAQEAERRKRGLFNSWLIE
jgi:hypothetical protein